MLRGCIIMLLLPVLFLSGGYRSSHAMNLADLPASRRVDWSTAGYPGPIPDLTLNVIDITEHSAVSNGTGDNSQVIQKLINEISVPAVIYFPAGTYRFQSAINLKTGVVLRGAGSEKTTLLCSSRNGCINISGRNTGNYRAITAGFHKGSTVITVSDASGFQVGHGGEIRQEDIDEVDPTGEWGQKSWAPTHVVGQMIKIVAINGNRITIEPPLHFTFTEQKNPEILPVEYINHCGIEDLTLQRLNTGSGTNNISIRRAADCWFRRVESDNTEKYHFSISKSLHLEIRTCYIHDAYNKGGGGQGYGTSLGSYVTSVLVEDNIFSDLRHSMIIQLGTNGCVFGYNYAQRNYSDDGWGKTYISVHGHYPYMNLFEGNIIGYAGLADYWGASGPGNTLFRNRAIGTDKHQNFGPYRGISIDDYSHRQNIIGNELTGSDTKITFDGSTDSNQGTSQNVIVHGNNVHGSIHWDTFFNDQTLPASFYLVHKPQFFGSLRWPSIGADMVLGAGTIPAAERLYRKEYIPQPASNRANIIWSLIPLFSHKEK